MYTCRIIPLRVKKWMVNAFVTFKYVAKFPSLKIKPINATTTNFYLGGQTSRFLKI